MTDLSRRQRLIIFVISNRQNLLVTASAILLSLGWIVGAAYYDKQDTASAGRGGALGIALSFYLLFIGGRLGNRVFGILTRGSLDKPDSLNAEKKADAVIAWLNTNAAESKRQNWFLAAASITGTLAWGFGDLAARHVPDFLTQGFGFFVTLF